MKKQNYEEQEQEKRRGMESRKDIKGKNGRNIDIDISKIRKKSSIFVLFFIHKCKMISTSSCSELVLVRR